MTVTKSTGQPTSRPPNHRLVRPVRLVRSVRSAWPVQPDRPVLSVRFRPVRPVRPDRPARLACPVRPARSARPVRSGRPARTGPVGSSGFVGHDSRITHAPGYSRDSRLTHHSRSQAQFSLQKQAVLEGPCSIPGIHRLALRCIGRPVPTPPHSIPPLPPATLRATSFHLTPLRSITFHRIL